MRDPQLPQLQDDLDEGAGRDSIQASRDKRKRKKNKDKKRLDTTPIELTVGMEVLLQGVKSKLWNIQGVVTEIRTGAILPLFMCLRRTKPT